MFSRRAAAIIRATPRFAPASVAARRFLSAAAPPAEEEAAEAAVGPDAILQDEEFRRPTIADVQSLPQHISDFPANLLVSACLHGHADAIRERLVREVMRVDGTKWTVASSTVDAMETYNQQGLWMIKAPYYFGITAGFVGAWGCLPFVFDVNTALWFNEAYVTTEIPPPEDLETWLEVGAWTWNWMEPFLGTISFQLLALQLMRNQMLNVGFKPWTSFIMHRRANRLANQFHGYNAGIVRDFSISNTGFSV